MGLVGSSRLERLLDVEHAGLAPNRGASRCRSFRRCGRDGVQKGLLVRACSLPRAVSPLLLQLPLEAAQRLTQPQQGLLLRSLLLLLRLCVLDGEISRQDPIDLSPPRIFESARSQLLI